MANQPLAFAELGLGGVLLVSAVKKIPLAEVFKHGLSGQSSAAGAPSVASGKTGESATDVPTEQNPEGRTTKAAAPNGSALLEGQTAKELESYLKRKLTSKERAGLKSLSKKGEL